MSITPITLNPAPAPAPSCWNCIRADLFLGSPSTQWEPDEPAFAECQHECWQDRQENGDGPEVAGSCPGFIARMVETCAGCGADLHQPEHTHELWAADPWAERLPVCSPACKAAHEARVAQEIELERQGW